MHKIKHLIITCIDFRFRTAVNKWISNNLNDEPYDLISLAGCLKDLVKPQKESQREDFLRQIEISTKLHGTDTLLTFEHQDCGGYASDGTIPSGLDSDTDKMCHKDFVIEAKNILKQAYPDLNVKSYFVDLSGNIEEI